MKREAYSHPKMLALAASLDVSRAEAIGYVTLLFDWTIDFAVQGNIGKWPNGAIARACDWRGDPDAFVSALVSCGWLDAHDDYRLIVHDWAHHCERFVKSKLASLGLNFLPCYFAQNPNSDDVSGDVSNDVEGDPPRDQTKPNQTVPTPTKPNHVAASPRGVSTKLTVGDLADTAKLKAWLAEQSRRKGAKLTTSEADLLRVVSAAERAIEKAIDPPAMFVSIVSKAQWNLISADQEDRARKRIRESNQPRDGTSDNHLAKAARDLAAKMKLDQ